MGALQQVSGLTQDFLSVSPYLIVGIATSIYIIGWYVYSWSRLSHIPGPWLATWSCKYKHVTCFCVLPIILRDFLSLWRRCLSDVVPGTTQANKLWEIDKPFEWSFEREI
jgi:hypothetical protein